MDFSLFRVTQINFFVKILPFVCVICLKLGNFGHFEAFHREPILAFVLAQAVGIAVGFHSSGQ